MCLKMNHNHGNKSMMPIVDLHNQAFKDKSAEVPTLNNDWEGKKEYRDIRKKKKTLIDIELTLRAQKLMNGA